MKITPLILGRGRAGHAIAESLAVLNVLEPELGLAPCRWLNRNENLTAAVRAVESPLIVIAGPHALHASAILDAVRAKAYGVVTEKPSCVNAQQLHQLSELNHKVGIFHVYRMMWGPQKLKEMLDGGQFGSLITIEGRYWQASTAERTVRPPTLDAQAKDWKNNPDLSGPSDALLDVGVHWLDAVTFLVGSMPTQINGWRSYKNSQTAHRESHLQLALEFADDVRGFGSISKTMHGATNHFEINVIGTRASATWTFLNPDEIIIGEGRRRSILTREPDVLGTGRPPFHGAGWIEGYIEILRRYLSDLKRSRLEPNPQFGPVNYPELRSNLELMKRILAISWN